MRWHSLFAALLLVGCASAPTKLEIQNADYGQTVRRSTCIDIAQRFVKNKMKDADSARFSGVQCYRGWESNVPIAGIPATFGYRFVGKVNAKNSFGGYAGFTAFSGIIKDADDGRGARVIRYCIVSVSSEYQLCIPSLLK